MGRQEEVELVQDSGVFPLSCVHSIFNIKWQSKVTKKKKNMGPGQSPGSKSCVQALQSMTLYLQDAHEGGQMATRFWDILLL